MINRIRVKLIKSSGEAVTPQNSKLINRTYKPQRNNKISMQTYKE